MSENARLKVSILIPVYNTAEYLPKCLESVMDQTLREIEIVAVNDASPDRAADVLAEYAKRDARIRIVTHEKNGGILAARLSGIAAATGEYVICLDADDTLDLDIARAAYEKAVSTGADMVHFQFDVRMGNGKKTPFAREVQKNLEPYRGSLLGRRVFEGAFVERLYRWNICGKMIALEVIRKAAAALPPGYYIMAEDFCFYTLMSFYSKHYEPLIKRGYNYVLDIGVSAYSAASGRAYERSCSVFTALNAVRSFLTANGVFETYEKAFRFQEQLLLGDLCDRWLNRLIAADRARGFAYMLEHYDPFAIVRAVIAASSDPADELKFARYAPQAENSAAQTEKIAIFADRIADSGFTAQLFEAVRERPDVTVVTADIVSPVPHGFRKMHVSAKTALERFDAWREILISEKFGTILYVEPENGGDAFFDLLTLRASGARVIAVPTRSFFSIFDTTSGAFLVRAAAFRLASAVAVFDSGEAKAFRSLGVCTHEIPPVAVFGQRPGKRSGVLFAGDAGDEKALSSTLASFAECAKIFPDARLEILTPAFAEEAERELRLAEKAFGIEGKCTVQTGVDANLDAALEKAAAVVVAGVNGSTVPLAFRRLAVPVFSGDALTQEELAEKLRSALAAPKESEPDETISTSGSNAWQEVFVPSGRPEADPALTRLLDGMGEAALHYERYAITPPRAGDTFFSFYRFFDGKLAHWLKPGSKKRHTVFAGLRHIMRRLFGKG